MLYQVCEQDARADRCALVWLTVHQYLHVGISVSYSATQPSTQVYLSYLQTTRCRHRRTEVGHSQTDNEDAAAGQKPGPHHAGRPGG